MMSTDNDRYGTFKGEPASEDAWAPVNDDNWDDMGMTPQEQFDILFGYAEERHIENEHKYHYSDGYEL